MEDKKEESRATREGIKDALEEEFYKVHERIMASEASLFEIGELCVLIKAQVYLARQIAREEKSTGRDVPSPEGEILSVLQEIKDILERMAGTSSAATLEPGVVVNLATTCAPGMTKEDIQTHCRLSQEEFDKMLQDYVKREAKITYAGGTGGGAPGVGISIPCPPPTHVPNTEGVR